MVHLSRRVQLFGALAAAVALFLLWSLRPTPIAVDLARVARGPLRVTIDEEGETRVRDVFVVSAPLSGHARRIEVEAGDPVEAGDTVLVELEPLEPAFLDVRSDAETRAAVRAGEAARALAAAELEKARAEADYARGESERVANLFNQGAASVRQRDQALRDRQARRAAVAKAEADLRRRSFELDRARARLVAPGRHENHDACECLPIHAPVSGRVLRVLHESEGVVRAGEPLLELGDPADLEIVADLLSSDAVQVERGQRVLIEAWGGEATLGGRVRRVEPYGFTKVSALGIEEQRVNVIIDFTDPAESRRRLGHGFRVEVRVVVWEEEDVLRVPLTALFRHGEAWAVFAEDEGRARVRPVEVGRRGRREAEIRGGLSEGTVVLRYLSEGVADGARVEAR